MRSGFSNPHKKGSASKTSSSSFQSPHTLCDCGDDLILMTSKTVSNPGKKFWRCPNWKNNMSCDFFQWVDEEWLDKGTSMEDVEGYVMEIAQLKKVSKLQRKLCDVRNMRKWLIVCLVFSWALMVVV
ncbi:Zinc finger, GRF-type [Sesbania bispinosa]|nr:Zinc finger, GRF-type [Sesbania bispinosa]